MALIRKTAAEVQLEESEIHKSLKTWYLQPGLQRELRNKENEAVQAVLEILERRCRPAKSANAGPEARSASSARA